MSRAKCNTTGACSLVGQSARLITGRSGVQLPSGPPRVSRIFLDLNGDWDGESESNSTVCSMLFLSHFITTVMRVASVGLTNR